MNVKSQKKIPFPIYQGSPDETRDMVISRMVDQLGDVVLPPEFYTTLANLINQKFLESPVEAMRKDLEDLNAKIRALEATMNIQQRTPKRYAANGR
jgi:hypothetical protein